MYLDLYLVHHICCVQNQEKGKHETLKRNVTFYLMFLKNAEDDMSLPFHIFFLCDKNQDKLFCELHFHVGWGEIFNSKQMFWTTHDVHYLV